MSEQITIEKSLRDWWSRVKAGQVGALPAILGLLVLCIVFGSLSSVFLTPGNFANLLTQAAAVTVIAMGLVFVLLLGEIDLSAGYAAGVCGAILVIMVTEMDFAWYIAFPVSILGGIILGAGIGYLVAQLKIPSFVVTLATFLAFQGLLLLLVGEGGTIRIEDPVILAVENKNLSVSASWIFFFVTSGAYVLSGLWKFTKRRRAGLVDNLFKFWLIKSIGLVIIGAAATSALTVERSNNHTTRQLAWNSLCSTSDSCFACGSNFCTHAHVVWLTYLRSRWKCRSRATRRYQCKDGSHHCIHDLFWFCCSRWNDLRFSR